MYYNFIFGLLFKMNVFKVLLSKKVEKQLTKIPQHIAIKLAAWIEDVGSCGIYEVRKIPGYHDEPLKGQRKGERSIRLSKQYRAIYIILSERALIQIVEVNKHEY